MTGLIRIGTASWTDPGFIADWYPGALPASERLPYYARHFNFVEVNSSFYAVPARKVVQRWCEQTPADFTFDIKLHRLLSRHSTTLQSLPPDLRGLAEVQRNQVQLSPALEAALVKTLLAEIRPLLDQGKLGAFLLQLTPAFGPRSRQLGELDHLLDLLSPHPVAVELRNRGWLTGDQLKKTTAFFRQRQVCLVGVDAPRSEHFMVMPSADVVTSPKLAYLRLHGRNAKGYLTGKTVAERFDYLYSDRELEDLAQRAVKLAEKAAETHVVYNNNCSDYPLRNADAFQRLLARRFPGIKRGVRPSSAPADPAHAPPEQTMEFDFVAPSKRR